MDIHRHTARIFQRSTGSALLDNLLFLALGAGATALLIIVFGASRDASRVNDTLAQIASIRQAVRVIASNDPQAASRITTLMVAQSGFLNPALTHSEGTITTPFGGNAVITGTNPGYLLDLGFLPVSACLRIMPTIVQDDDLTKAEIEVPDNKGSASFTGQSVTPSAGELSDACALGQSIGRVVVRMEYLNTTEVFTKTIFSARQTTNGVTQGPVTIGPMTTQPMKRTTADGSAVFPGGATVDLAYDDTSAPPPSGDPSATPPRQVVATITLNAAAQTSGTGTGPSTGDTYAMTGQTTVSSTAPISNFDFSGNGFVNGEDGGNSYTTQVTLTDSSGNVVYDVSKSSDGTQTVTVSPAGALAPGTYGVTYTVTMHTANTDTAQHDMTVNTLTMTWSPTDSAPPPPPPPPPFSSDPLPPYVVPPITPDIVPLDAPQSPTD